MHAIAYNNPAPLRARRAETPSRVESLVRRALKKDPSDRFSEAGALTVELERCLHAIKATQSQGRQGRGRRGRFDQPTILGTAAFSAGGLATDPDTGIASQAPVPVPYPDAESPLVGRLRERAELKSALDSALDGHGQLVLISGEAGIGKTRLVAECGWHFESLGGNYVVGRCLFREGRLPYRPFVEAAERLVMLLGVESADELEQIVRERMPLLRGRLPILLSFLHLPGSLASEGEEAVNKEHLLDAITAFFVQVAKERPILVHIDDLHWADEGTLDLFEYLARSLRPTRGVLVGAYRPEEAKGLISRLSSGDRYLHVPLERLGIEETEEVVRGALPGANLDQTLIKRLHRDTAGNPFFLLEALRLLRADGLVRREADTWVVDSGAAIAAIPGRVHDVLAQRLDRLSTEERQLLEVRACEGATFRSSTLVASLQTDRYKTLSSLQILEREYKLIRTEEDGFRFDHPMIREALYESIIPELRREYHSRIARHLVELSGGKLLA